MATRNLHEDLLTRVRQAAELRGILGAAARHHLARPGKQLRGLLAYDLAVSLGADAADALELGAACELLHNASLVHDDIQDGDVIRRGRESTWVRFGQPVAINLGDHLLASAFGRLAAMRAPAERRTLLIACFARSTSIIACGQSDEILRRDDLLLDRARYEQIARDKTGPLFALPLECAAILAGVDQISIDAMRRGGLELGAAFQLTDDLADLLDRKNRGEPGADLREGKLTWPVLAFLEHATESTRQQLLGLLAAREGRTADVAPWVQRILASGVVEGTLRRVRELLADARAAWSALPPACTALLSRELDRFAQALPDVSAPPTESEVRVEAAR